MLDTPRQKLCELVAAYGPSLTDNPARCEGLLRDLCGQHPREIHLLVSAARQKVPAELQAGSRLEPVPSLMARLVRKLQDNLALEERAAWWAVESWAIALQLIGPNTAPLIPPRAPQPPGPIFPVPEPTAAPPDVSVVWADAPVTPPSAPAVPTLPPQVPATPTRADSSTVPWVIAAVLGAISLVAVTVVVVLLLQPRPAAEGGNSGSGGLEARFQPAAPPLNTAPPPSPLPSSVPSPGEQNAPSPLGDPANGSEPAVTVTEPPTAPVQDDLAAAQELLQRGETRRAASDEMMEQHRQARTELEKTVGPNSAALDSAYTDYPHETQMTAYAQLAQEAHEDAEKARAFSQLTPDQRRLLSDYLEAQHDTYLEIRAALEMESRSGYQAARQLWDQERVGAYRRTDALRQQVQSAFNP